MERVIAISTSAAIRTSVIEGASPLTYPVLGRIRMCMNRKAPKPKIDTHADLLQETMYLPSMNLRGRRANTADSSPHMNTVISAELRTTRIIDGDSPLAAAVTGADRNQAPSATTVIDNEHRADMRPSMRSSSSVSYSRPASTPKRKPGRKCSNRESKTLPPPTPRLPHT